MQRFYDYEDEKANPDYSMKNQQNQVIGSRFPRLLKVSGLQASLPRFLSVTGDYPQAYYMK
jgi:hypothetical protein